LLNKKHPNLKVLLKLWNLSLPIVEWRRLD